MNSNLEPYFFAYYLDDDDLIEHADAHPSLWVTIDMRENDTGWYYTVVAANANPRRRSWFENTKRLLDRRIRAGDFGADCLITENEAKGFAQMLGVDLDDAKAMLTSSFQKSRDHTPQMIDGTGLTQDRIANARHRFVDRLLSTFGKS